MRMNTVVPTTNRVHTELAIHPFNFNTVTIYKCTMYHHVQTTCTMFAIINVGRLCVRSISCPNIETFTSALMHYNGLNACALMGCRYVHNLLLDFAHTFTTDSAVYSL